MTAPRELPRFDPTTMTTDPAVAAAALAGGGLIGFPTETVYGLAADADNAAAIARVFAVKGRPIDHPLIVHIAADAVGSLIDDGWRAPFARADLGERETWFEALATRFWPGPLTLIVPAGPRVLPIITGGRPTVALRTPAHPMAQAILSRFGSPVVAPSANRFGRVSPTNAHHVLADLGRELADGTDVIVDGGDAPVGLESTIVDISTESIPQVLRHGSISLDDVAVALDRPVNEPSGPVRASGMHDAHYSPHGHVHLVDNERDARNVAETAARDGIVLVVIDRSHDPLDAARHLYRDLRRADDVDVDGIVVVMPEARGIGVAVRDRLRRAAIGSGRPNRGD